MFRTCHAHHQEKQIVSIQLPVIVTPCWWRCRVLVGSKHDMLETCRELLINKYIEKNLCVKLGNYQESLHDARSTKR